ncbi:MAG: energy transducer TonB [Alloprevotella sp.]|nr:energy transducer TonB [Alloprevotella sp.]
MRQFLALLAAMLLTCAQGIHAQQTDVVLDNPKKRPLVVLDDETVPFSMLEQIPSDSIGNITVFDSKTARLFYGKQAKYGAVQITTKQFLAKVEALQQGFENETYQPKGMERPATWPKGEKDFWKYVYSNIDYPGDAISMNIQGTVLVRFRIGTEGQVENPQIIKSLCHTCDNAVLRMLGNMPKWIPALDENGDPAPVYFEMPVTFKID